MSPILDGLISSLPLAMTELLLLSTTALFTSAVTASMGIGGGVLLLAVMANILPPLALIPVHGLVQFGSNAGRAWMTRLHIDWQMVLYFSCGALLGGILGFSVLIQVPVGWLLVAVATFILYSVWGGKPEKHQLTNTGIAFAGLGTTTISMFVGATGPLVASFVFRQQYDKRTTVATFASCMTLQHLLKMVVFSVAGFTFWPWLLPVVLMVFCGLVGTWLGLKLLDKLPTELFKQTFRWVLTLLSLRLLWQAFELLVQH